MVFVYFLHQLGSTLTALFVLGAVGGWSLWLFRSKERPYLWLAAPLAGIGVLSLSLTTLFHVCRLTLPWAFGISVIIHAGTTGVLVAREGLPRRRSRDWVVAAVLLLIVASAAVRVVQDSAIRAREPTILMIGGSDQFGYSHVGDWIVRHPHQTPEATPERPYESWLELMESDRRQGAFLLAATAGWVRGTTTLFSYDWATGVVLAAGLLGFATAFARRPGPLLLLLVAAALSVWYRNSRTGYFAKTLTYPGFLLLTHLFIRTWSRTTTLRVLCVVALATGFALCLSPISILALFGVLGVGALGARLVALAVALARREGWPAMEPGPLWKGGLLALACSLPICLAASDTLCLLKPYEWGSHPSSEYVCAEALDVGSIWEEPSDAPATLREFLIAAALVGCAIGFVAAIACQATVAAGLFACSGVVAACALPGRDWSIYQMQGLLYPLALAGGALLWQQVSVWRSRWLRLAGAALVLALAAPRVPQLNGALKRTMKPHPGVPGFIACSEVATMVNRVGAGPVDLCQHEVCTCLVALVELGARGIPVHYDPRTWQLAVGYRGWPAPHYAQPGRHLLTWCDCRLPEGAAVSSLGALVPSGGTWVIDVKPPLGLGRDPSLGLQFWIGAEPVQFELCNSMTEPTDVVFVSEAVILASGKRMLTWQAADQRGQVEMTSADRELHIPLRLPPGEHRLMLHLEDFAPSNAPENGLLLRQFGVIRANQAR